jgi:hypothetical protein
MSASPHKTNAHFQETVALLNYIIRILMEYYVSLAPLHIHLNTVGSIKQYYLQCSGEGTTLYRFTRK